MLDDFGLRKLTAQQSSDFYDVLVERDKRAATVITSNRAVDEWVALFDDPILANSALDRFAHRAHQIVCPDPAACRSSATVSGVSDFGHGLGERLALRCAEATRRRRREAADR